MKATALIIFLVVFGLDTFAQGYVKFYNTPTTLVSYGPAGGPYVVTPRGGLNFYYALLTAAVGTTDPTAFTFSGVYATNTFETPGGRFRGGGDLGVRVPGWEALTSLSFEVAGWSANFGPFWDPAWLTIPPSNGAFGISEIGTGIAGDFSTTPSLAIFGPSPSIDHGFTLVVIPEPSATALGALCGLSIICFGRKWKSPTTKGMKNWIYAL